MQKTIKVRETIEVSEVSYKGKVTSLHGLQVSEVANPRR